MKYGISTDGKLLSDEADAITQRRQPFPFTQKIDGNPDKETSHDVVSTVDVVGDDIQPVKQVKIGKFAFKGPALEIQQD